MEFDDLIFNSDQFIDFRGNQVLALELNTRTARKKSSWWRLPLFAVGSLLAVLVLHFVINGYLVARKMNAVEAEDRNMKSIGLAISNYYDNSKRQPKWRLPPFLFHNAGRSSVLED